MAGVRGTVAAGVGAGGAGATGTIDATAAAASMCVAVTASSLRGAGTEEGGGAGASAAADSGRATGAPDAPLDDGSLAGYSLVWSSSGDTAFGGNLEGGAISPDPEPDPALSSWVKSAFCGAVRAIDSARVGWDNAAAGFWA